MREFNLVKKRLSGENNDEGRKALNKEKSLKYAKYSSDDYIMSRGTRANKRWNGIETKAARKRVDWGRGVQYTTMLLLLSCR